MTTIFCTVHSNSQSVIALRSVELVFYARRSATGYDSYSLTSKIGRVISTHRRNLAHREEKYYMVLALKCTKFNE